MQIDGQEYSLFRDYDQGKFHFLSDAGRVTYLEARVRLILVGPCQSTMKDAQTNYLGLVLTTAICAGISAASTFLKGRRASKKGEDKQFFVDFVTQYMDAVLISRLPGGHTWASWLYHDVRCGLAHNFTIETGGIEVGLTRYVQITGSGPQIEPQKFLDDFEMGWSKYLQDVRKGGIHSSLGAKFNTRFLEVFHD
jgi:hypothetical protein